jgi:hypothetical protein
VERLEHEADVPRAQGRAAVLVEGGEVAAGEAHGSRGRLVEPGEQREQRGLARAGGAHDGHGLAAHDRERDVRQNGERSLGAANLLAQPAASSTVSIRSALIVILPAVLDAVRAGRAAESPKILVLGDSLSAAYGMRVEQGWVALLQAAWKPKGTGTGWSMPVRAAKPPAARWRGCPGRSSGIARRS